MYISAFKNDAGLGMNVRNECCNCVVVNRLYWPLHVSECARVSLPSEVRVKRFD